MWPVLQVSLFADEGEELTFWQLQARVHAAGQVLYGFYSGASLPCAALNARMEDAKARPPGWNDNQLAGCYTSCRL